MNAFSDGCILPVGTMIASSLMDKQGRKSLLITSFSGMVCLQEITLSLVSVGKQRFSLTSVSLEGSFHATASIVIYLESVGTLFWNSCCCWHCSVSFFYHSSIMVITIVLLYWL
jgi:hypothetical protein